MSPSKQANSVEDAGLQQQNQQQSQQNKFTELLKKTVKDFSKWSTKKQMAAVSIVGAVLPLLILAVPGVVVGLVLFFAVEAVLYTLKGLKWSGKKAKDGFKYVAKETVEGYKHSMDSLKRGVSAVGSTMREGTSDTLKTVGRKLSGLGESMGDLDSIPYSIAHKDKGVVLLEEEKTKKFSSVKELFSKEIFQDKISNKSALVKKVLSKIGSKIAEKAYSVPSGGVNNSKLISQLGDQADFISKLDAKKLKNLLAENNYDPQLYKIFSEHHDEIKSIIKECKEEQTRLNAAAEVRGRSKSAPVQPTGSLSESSSLNSVSTDGSEAELLNPKKRKKLKLSSGFSWPIRGKSAKEKTTEIGYKILSKSPPVNIATIGANRNSSQALGSIPVAPPKPPRVAVTRSDSSGNLNSSMDYAEGLNPFAETVSTGPDFITNIGDKPLRTRSNSLASTSSFVSTSSRLSDSVSADSFAFQGSEMPKAPPLPLDGKILTIRSESPSSDSGVSSAGSSNGRNSPNPSIKHTGPQVQVKMPELLERKNSLNKTGSLEKLVPPQSQMNIHTEVQQQGTAAKPLT